MVWGAKILCKIPYGETLTYGEIAKILAKKKGLARMSAQAVGSAVGHNNISIIVPCHRVVGTNRGLTWYAAGIDKKNQALKIRKSQARFFCHSYQRHSIISTKTRQNCPKIAHPKTMHKESKILSLILRFAQNHQAIRVVTLEGSRTNPNIKKIDFAIVILAFS